MEKEYNTNTQDEWIDRALRAEQELPEGLCGRLEQQIDAWQAAERRQKRTPKHRLAYWMGSAAAAMLLAVGIFIHVSRVYEPQPDAQELAEAQVAQEALLCFFGNLNKGMAQLDNAARAMDKVNGVLNKTTKISVTE